MMSELEKGALLRIKEAVEVVQGLSPATLETYARLWQLETWLRKMIYLELRALAGNQWETLVRSSRARGSLESDKRLTHMSTSQQNIPSYAQLADLRATIEGNWRLFHQYLPPMDVWKSRMLEVEQVRHRIAHFRTGHHDDLARVTLLLRDMDRGMWLFCTSYNDARPVLPPTADPVIERFLPLDPFPWLETSEGKWARCGMADPAAPFGMMIEVLRRPWVTGASPSRVAGTSGYLYDVSILARQHREFNCARFLQDTDRLHPRLTYIHPNGPLGVRLTIPAVLGESDVSETIQTLIQWISNALNPTTRYRVEDADEQLAGEWPEYVLGPQDPLSYLCPDMECAFFGA